MAPKETKPRVFIGSSSEGKPLAEYLKRFLADYLEVTIWTEAFDLSEGTLQSLVLASEEVDFAILVLTPDTMVTKRGKRRPAPIDNVVFEIGLFMGALGRERTFVVWRENVKLELPSDLAGVTLANYTQNAEEDIETALSRLAMKIKKAVEKVQAREIPGSFDEVVFNWMKLPKSARKMLGRSKFVKFGGTENALTMLIDLAKDDRSYSILAICGYKGSYSTRYYKENFKRCKVVKRIFSYDAIRDEFKKKKDRFALDGLNLHLDEIANNRGNVEVFFIKKGKRINQLGNRDFDPPLSFGLAILLDGNNSPRRAVVHWEVDAEPLKHLIDIEGVIIDERQDKLLKKLVELHTSIAGSNGVLSSKEDSEEIAAACKELDKVWKSRRRSRERGKR